MEHWQAVSPQNAYIMATLLKEVVNQGTGGRAKVEGRIIAGKTGTTNDEHDAWFVGFSPYLVTGVYVGYDQLRSLGRLEQGGRTAAPIFRYYRSTIEHLYPNDDFTMPEGIVMADGLAFKADEPMPGRFGYSAGHRGRQRGGHLSGGEDLMRQMF